MLKYFGWWTTSITGRPEKGWDEAGNIRWTRPFSTSWGGVEKITLTWFKTFLGGEEEMHRYEPTTFDPPPPFRRPKPRHNFVLFFCFFLFLYPVRLGLFCYFTSTGRLTSFVTFLSISRRPLFFLFTPPIPHRRTTWLQHTNKKKNIVNGLWIHTVHILLPSWP